MKRILIFDDVNTLGNKNGMFACWAVAFISKPFEINAFFEKIETVLAQERNNLKPH